MPVSLTTKSRKPEAYIHFSSVEQQQFARQTNFDIEGHRTCWIDILQVLCHHCGNPDHKQRDCPRLKSIISVSATRRANAAIIKGSSPSSGSASRSPLTQVPRSGPVPSPSPKQIESLRSTPPTLSRAGSYAAALSPKKKGFTASSPISIASTASTNPARTPSVSFANATTSASASSSAALTDPIQKQMNEFSARLNALASRLDSYIQQQATESHATNTRLEAKLDRLLNAIGTPPVQSQGAIEPEDIELEQADD
ncbi:hypothetical protein BGX33_003398, partial [Mortierella sp. NVP41]